MASFYTPWPVRRLYRPRIRCLLSPRPRYLYRHHGYAFALAFSKFVFPSIGTGAYIHYPTISTDMLGSLDTPPTFGQGLNAGTGKGVRGFLKNSTGIYSPISIAALAAPWIW